MIGSIVRGVAVVVVLTWLFLFAFVMTTASQAGAAAPVLPSETIEQRRARPVTSVAAVEPTVMCPSCDTTLDHSDSPAADRMRAWIEEAVAAGWTAEEIRDGLVDEYGGNEAILAVPRARGIGMLVWIVPLLVVLVAGTSAAFVLRSWRRRARQPEART